MLEKSMRDVCTELSSEDIRKIASSLTVMANEKQKEEKAVDQKKKANKKGKPMLKADSTAIDDPMEDNKDYGEYDDFM
jgi:translation initiation factor 3 subunit J